MHEIGLGNAGGTVMRGAILPRFLRRVSGGVIGALLLLFAGSGVGTAGAVTGADPSTPVQDAAASVDSYWRRSFHEAGQSYRPVARVYGYEPDDGSRCDDRPNVPRNALYCVADNEIAYDRAWLDQEYQRIGDAFVYFVIGHEWAHAIQAQLGVMHRFTIQYELQADCLSGAYLAGEIEVGELQLDAGDLDELRSGLKEVGDPADVPWFTPGAHGTAAQREHAFTAGYDGGQDTCF
jgi:predicted metalloprotease